MSCAHTTTGVAGCRHRVVMAFAVLFVCVPQSHVFAGPFQRHRRKSVLAMVIPSSLSTPIPPPPPISMPIWTLAAPIPTTETSTVEQETSMCIITFASAVSVAPPKLWIISLYANTLTRNSFCSAGCGVLQLLASQHKYLVPILGKRSGYEQGFSKRDECANLGFPWVKCSECSASLSPRFHLLSGDQSAISNLDLLPNCSVYIYFKLLSLSDAGDHDVALCEVVGTGLWDENMSEVVLLDEAPSFSLDHESALYTGELRRDGIL